jgi:hypothetical protein
MNGRIFWSNKSWDVEILTYQNTGHIALCIVEVSDSMMVEDYMISTKISYLNQDEIAIWNFDNTAGILDALVNGEVVEPAHKYVKGKYGDLEIHIPVVRLKNSFMNFVGIKDSQPKQKSHSIANSARPAAK